MSYPLSKARVCLSCYLCVVMFMNAGGHDPGTEPPSVDPKTGTSHRIGNSPQTIGKVDLDRREGNGSWMRMLELQYFGSCNGMD